jgi:hypothetical protein
VKAAKGADGGEAGRGNPAPPSPSLPSAESSEQTPFERFVEFARKIVAVPKSEIDEQERIYKSQRRTRKKKGASPKSP